MLRNFTHFTLIEITTLISLSLNNKCRFHEMTRYIISLRASPRHLKTCQSSQPANFKAIFINVFWLFLADLLHPELYHEENIEDFQPYEVFNIVSNEPYYISINLAGMHHKWCSDRFTSESLACFLSLSRKCTVGFWAERFVETSCALWLENEVDESAVTKPKQ